MELIHRMGINSAIRKVLNKEIIYLLIVVYLGYRLGLMVGRPSKLFPFIALATSLFLIIKIKYLIYAVLIWVVTGFYLIDEIELPGQAHYVDELFEVLALGYLLAFVVIKGRRFKKTPFDKYFWGYVGIVIASAIGHLVPPKISVEFLFANIKPIIFFYLLINLDLKEDFYKRLVKLIIALGLVQVIVNTMWLLGIDILPNPRGRLGEQDFGIGIIGGALGVGYLTSICIIITIGYYFYQRKRKYLFLTLLFLYNLALTDSKAFYVIVPFTILWTILVVTPKITSKISKSVFITLLASILFFFAVNIHFRTIRNFQGPYFSEGYRAKVLGWRQILSFVKDNPFFIFLGHGPGMYASGTAIKYKTKLFQEYILSHYSESVSFANPNSGMIAIAGDVGPLALLFFLLMLYSLYKLALKILKTAKEPDLKVYSFIVATGLVFMVVVSLIRKGFEASLITFPVWLIAAGMYTLWEKQSLANTRFKSCTNKGTRRVNNVRHRGLRRFFRKAD